MKTKFMKSKFIVRALGLLSLGLFSFINMAQAKVESWSFDKEHSYIGYEVMHAGFSISHGVFHQFNGKFMYDPKDPQKSTLDIVIPAQSIDSYNKARNEHLLSKDLFNVAKYPNLTFKSTSVEMVGKTKAKVKGNLTMAGVTKPITLNVKLIKSGPNPFTGKPMAGFSAVGEIKRSDWGLDWGLDFGGTAVIGDKVKLIIDVETLPVVKKEPK